ncbi:hypothetical protein CHH77_02940 [Shouchella clausii]|nr:hypothetical protein WZ76_16275 [Shouchella clausii]PAE84804.1 hypothetical protein CHH77_02940 [Shouchella clausii]PAE95431.1 hypothetical protein CHH70_04760 [Shouchella clausii]
MELTKISSFFKGILKKKAQKGLDIENDIHYHLVCKIPLIPFQSFPLKPLPLRQRLFLLAESIFLIAVGTKSKKNRHFSCFFATMI